MARRNRVVNQEDLDNSNTGSRRSRRPRNTDSGRFEGDNFGEGQRSSHLAYLSEMQRYQEPQAQTMLESLSFGMKDVIVVGTVVVSIVTAWGTLHTRLALLEKEVSILNEEVSEYKNKDDQDIEDLRESIIDIREALTKATNRTNSLESTMRNYIYSNRRRDRGTYDKNGRSPP